MTAPQQAPPSTVLVEGQVTVRPASTATWDRFMDEFLSVELPQLRRAGVRVVGAFRRLTGRANELVHVYGFSSLGSMERKGLAIEEDGGDALASLYRWVDNEAFRYRRLLGIRTSFAPPEPPTPTDGQTPLYVECRYTARFARVNQVEPLLGQLFAHWCDAELAELAVAYALLHGDHGTVVSYARLRNGATSLDAMREDVPPGLRAALDALLVDEEHNLLVPQPYSPLS